LETNAWAAFLKMDKTVAAKTQEIVLKNKENLIKLIRRILSTYY
jgi:hypothetical protein